MDPDPGFTPDPVGTHAKLRKACMLFVGVLSEQFDVAKKPVIVTLQLPLEASVFGNRLILKIDTS